MEIFIIELYQKNLIKFGDFTLKSGKKSGIYFDLRTIISYPKLLDKMIDLFWEKIKDLDFDLICGVAYGAIPIASGICLKYGKPMLIKRKEKKDYGTKKLVEGEYAKGQKCLLIDDVMTTGGSIGENIEDLEKEGLIINEKVVFLDRREDEDKNLMKDVKYLITKAKVLEILNIYLGKNGNPIEKLRNISKNKKSKLILSADILKWQELKNLIFKAREHICAVKIHIDIMEDMGLNEIYELKKMARGYEFLVIEDRKFSDIANTVKLQYGYGTHRIAEWADLVTIHGIMGPGILEGMRQVLAERGLLERRGILIVAEASSHDNLINGEYTNRMIEMAKNNKDLVTGFITQHRLSDEFLNFTPGVNHDKKSDNCDQTYRNINIIDTDFIIVGRGIYEAEDITRAAIYYKGYNEIKK